MALPPSKLDASDESCHAERSKHARPRRRLVILGAAGRDFHNFNVAYRQDWSFEVVAFTAAQIPGTADRRYPAILAGPLYPDGIPILDEGRLEALCRDNFVEGVVFAYSDVPHEQVMHLASRVLAMGADFHLLGPDRTTLKSSLPVIAVTAVRTGCGKSAVTRWLSQRLRRCGLRVAVMRHPMPYGDLVNERVQRFASLDDLTAARCTAEEREEYEPHIAIGNVVFAGVDYLAALRAAEAEADIILWDGGNNDFPFVRPDLHIAIADALRPHQISTHHPGEAVARMADILIINKVDSASPEVVDAMSRELRAVNSDAVILRGAMPIALDDEAAVRGRRALVIEDGPTLTHGGMAYGAGYRAAIRAGAEVVNPRPASAPEIQRVFQAFPHLANVLPAVGYGPDQLHALEASINAIPADVVVSATPLDIGALVRINKNVVRVRYEFSEVDKPQLSVIVDAFVRTGKRPDRRATLSQDTFF